jgi:hypothetical protein
MAEIWIEILTDCETSSYVKESRINQRGDAALSW